MYHNFDITIATKYGLKEAIILNNLYFWITKNIANNKHFYVNTYWTFNSYKAFSELFPYFTERQVRYAINKLIEEGLIIKGNFNIKNYDNTNWYAFTDKGWNILEANTFYKNDKNKEKKGLKNNKKTKGYDKSDSIELTKLSDGCDKIVRPIPYINTYINNNNNNIPPTLEEVSQYCQERQNGIDAQTFIDFYESKGWMIGKNKMKDWKASIRTWERNNKKDIDTRYKEARIKEIEGKNKSVLQKIQETSLKADEIEKILNIKGDENDKARGKCIDSTNQILLSDTSS